MDLVEHTVIGTVSDRETRTGKGGHVLGDPRIALAWLVNELSGIGAAGLVALVVIAAHVPALRHILRLDPSDLLRGDAG